MKKLTLFVSAFLLLSIFFASCSKTGRIRIPVQVDPLVVLPLELQKVGIVNRSLVVEGENRKVLNVVEGVLTGEGVYEDRDGSFACLAGAATELNQLGLVEARVLDSVLLPGTGSGIQPLPLDWETVQVLCTDQGLDALLVLEVFDTDQSGSTTTNAINQVRDIANTGTVRPVAPVTNPRVHVKMAWRLYDHVHRQIVDETRMSDYFQTSSRSSSGIYDLGEFAKRDAIQRSGYVAGRSYALRFLPRYVNLYRDYYKRKGAEMERGARFCQVNNFDKAAEVWEAAAEHPKRKVAGRACYNMAVYWEIKGDLVMAREWAEKAYTDFGEQRGRDYARILQRRMQSGGVN